MAAFRLEPLPAPQLVESGQHRVSQFVEKKDVVGRIVEPRIRKRTAGPVGGRMGFGETDAEVFGDHRAEVDALDAEETARQFGIDQR